MGLGLFLRKQFVDILQWTEDAEGVLAWRYPMLDAEIRYGAQLTVRESQMAVFVNEGKVADVFGPGLHQLTTRTLPVLTYLKNWDKLFESPFKSDVYFFSTRLQLGRRWGTAQPVTIRDKDFGMVRMRAFGIYSYRLSDAGKFYREISGTRDVFTVDDLENQLRNLVVQSMSAAFGSADIPFVDMAASQVQLSARMTTELAPVFERYGVALDSFAVENVSLPDELQRTLDARISMGMIGDMNAYTKYQTAQAIPLAAQNEGGIAGVGAGIAAGASLGAAMAQSLNAASAAQATPVNMSTQSVPVDFAQRLAQLKSLLDQRLIETQEYETAKAEILKKLTG
ncbi:SPFH domain-containing protein [Caballeronia sp. LZ029]|uniref:SPFH domain-containing protein n=1 Tax=Caballeronia sp. LZ029 TaxID=3038564 RepID=UPI00285E2643|nr:SPFH domain-containing protein [Caballeronia sp. LZ029]MDR5745581.1 SPFH domain-containing protein [Caballeronia sp. LZ029]